MTMNCSHDALVGVVAQHTLYNYTLNKKMDMKRNAIATMFLSAALAVMPQISAYATGGDKASDGRQRLVRHVEAFFDNTLAGKPAAMKAGKAIAPGEAAEWQKLVWQAWQRANAAADEQRLTPLGALGDKARGAWVLPDSLEPNARMPYFYGHKASGDGTELGGEGPTALPLFVYLHGSGPKDQEWATGLKLAQWFKDAPSAYFIPQIPNEGRYYRWWTRAKQWAWEKLLRQSLATDAIDPNRIYIFGISEGAYGSQRLASFYADYLAAAGPMAGGEPLRNAPVENCSGIGFSFLTGAQDAAFFRNRFTHDAQLAFDSLQAMHPALFAHRIELIPGRGHHIDYSPTTPWLRQFVRNPHPKHFLWEDFAMDNRHRAGFYNLRVDHRPQLDSLSRTTYAVDIENNTVNVRVQTVSYEILQLDPFWHTIEMSMRRHYGEAHDVQFTIFLDPELVDLTRRVDVVVNGRKVYSGKPKLTLGNMVESVATFYDPCRIYPAAVRVKID